MKHMSQYGYDEHEIEKAITFLAKALEKLGHNPKPVLLHSIRVATILWNNGIPQKYVIAGILHDIGEDTSIKKTKLIKEFGDEVTNLIDILTITDKNDFEKSFEESVKDINLAAIRAADLIENSNYYSRADTNELKEKLFNKYTYFMKCAKNNLPKVIQDELNEAYKLNVECLLKETGI